MARRGSGSGDLRAALARCARVIRGWDTLVKPEEKIPKRVVFVAGNEAGDVDSIVSSIALSYLWGGLKVQAEAASRGGWKVEDEIAVPIALFPRREFRLRGDARSMFRKAGFEFDEFGAPKELLFIDDLSNSEHFDSIQSHPFTFLALTDHNVEGPKLQAVLPGKEVLVIVDHHQDAREHMGARLRRIDTGCGSACSLVSQLALENGILLPSELVLLLLGGILLDTRNFSETANRYNEIDLQVHEQLSKEYSTTIPDKEHQTKWFEELINARFDVSELHAEDLLRLDFKVGKITSGEFEGKSIGFCSIMDSVEGFYSRKSSLEVLEGVLGDMAEEYSLDLLICFGRSEKVPSFDNQKRKGLVMFEVDQDGALIDRVFMLLKACPDNLPATLKEDPLFVSQGVDELGFGPEVWEEYTTQRIKVFHIRKPITRKTLLPAVMDLLQI